MRRHARYKLYLTLNMRLHDRYQLYLTLADDGQGRDITRNLAPLMTFDQWIAA